MSPTLTSAQYLGLCEPLAYYQHNKGVPVVSVEEMVAGHNKITDEYQAEADEMTDRIAELERQLAEQKEALAQEKSKKKEKAPKKKSPPKKKKNSGGANHNLQKDLQKDGKLAPFREGGCRCRTWGDRMGTQCSNADIGEGFCKMHTNKMKKDEGWKLGFYDEKRPENWGDIPGALGSWEKKGKKIGWRMDEETWTKAFERDVCPPCLDDPIAESEEEEVVEDVESDAETLAFESEEEEDASSEGSADHLALVNVDADGHPLETDEEEGSSDGGEDYY